MNGIRIQGASEHNLRNVSLELPRNAITVFTGVSGSGKSSLAFDTIYREGQRRFLESLPAYARRLVAELKKPAVEHVEGLSPTIAVDQKTVGTSPRSTVATSAEIHEYLRLLYARLGIPHCPECGRSVEPQDAGRICDRVQELLGGKSAMVCAPVVRDRKGAHRSILEKLRHDGFVRARIDGRLVRLSQEVPELKRTAAHTIEVVWDRLRAAPQNRQRWIEAIEKCLGLADGVVSVVADDFREVFSARRVCPACSISFPDLDPRLFSFNSPHGRCLSCDGAGVASQIAPDRIISDPGRPLDRGGLAVFGRGGRFFDQALDATGFEAIARKHGFHSGCSWADLDAAARNAILYGDGPYRGIVPILGELAREGLHSGLPEFTADLPCEACGGSRLNSFARSVKLEGLGIHEVTAMSLATARAWVAGLSFSGSRAAVGEPIRKDLLHRLEYLEEVGLGYLTLDRPAGTLAGGEAQRLRLARHIGAALQGVLFVLDEPSIGLHSRDHGRLLDALKALQRLGNTVLVVEHDRATMVAADHLVDLGPGAGMLGGQVVAQGTLQDIEREPRSLTGQYLAGRREIPVPSARRVPRDAWIELYGVRHNNLKDIDVRVPVGLFTAVTGVSGSGKSSLVNQVLRPALARKLHRISERPGVHRSIRGERHIDKVIEVDQSALGKSPRSNPATYSKLFDEIRKLFASVPEARARGYDAGRFSFNREGGRCIECGGAGVTLVDLQFLAAVTVACDACGGRRYNRETLEIRYRGRNIHDVLEMSCSEALEFFRDHAAIFRRLETLERIGLGYVKLGQPCTTLSGGEAQRVKLATELQRPATGRTLYVLDEPTTGLHFDDIKRLLDALVLLVEKGNTVLVIEHNLDVIKTADHVIDLGPEAGDAGGRVVAEGPPEAIAATAASYTGRALKDVLGPGGTAEGNGSERRERPGPAHAAQDESRPSRDIEIAGACKHNLKNIDVRIPAGSLTVITGVSGSGKSSLAFDTLFAEGQRRYLESLSTYARRFLSRLEDPEVRRITGLSPTIAIDQKSASANPRSTVLTITEIHDYLRLLYARVGVPHCPRCGRSLQWTSPSRLAADLAARRPNERCLVLAPVHIPGMVPGSDAAAVLRADRLQGLQADLVKSGFTRVLAAGTEVRLDEEADGPVRRILSQIREASGQRTGKRAGQIERSDLLLVVDRVVVSAASQSRLAGSLELAFERGEGVAAIQFLDDEPGFFTRYPACPEGHFQFDGQLTPSMFSFSSHQGACLRCNGTGTEQRANPELVIRSPEKPLLRALDRGLLKFMTSCRPSAITLLKGLLESFGVSPQRPFAKLPPEAREAVLQGTASRNFALRLAGGLRTEASWPGLLQQVETWSREQPRTFARSIQHVLQPRECSVCGGGRLRPESLAVRVGGKSIQEFSGLTVRAAREFVETLTFEPRKAAVAERILAEIANRLRFLKDVGLDYLGLDRSAGTLSGGEAQRIRLASQLGNRLAGVLYVLDEPTVGLHQSDTRKLLAALKGLRDLGNTVVVVEHDRETLQQADWIVDIGPGPGDRGGKVVVCGKPADVAAHPESLTGRYLREGGAPPAGHRRRDPGAAWLELSGIRHHNLRGVQTAFPLGLFTVVSGVSGSGKSSLVTDVLAHAVSAHLGKGDGRGNLYETARGLSGLRRLVVVDQRPVGRTPRSTPATYLGIWDRVRDLFASLPESRVRGYGASRFSFNTQQGACPACGGKGALKVSMLFLSDVWVPCEVCGGARFPSETLSIRFKGKNVSDILQMEVDDAVEFFANQPRVVPLVESMRSVGLGYMKLGQPATTLSGGEAQRLKLAGELTSRREGGTLYILDEPTTGLHHADVVRLLAVLQALVEGGNTLVVIEHQLDVIQAADWVIDLGPGAGDDGGRIVAAGTPADIARNPQSPTGLCLAAEKNLPS